MRHTRHGLGITFKVVTAAAIAALAATACSSGGEPAAASPSQSSGSTVDEAEPAGSDESAAPEGETSEGLESAVLAEPFSLKMGLGPDFLPDSIAQEMGFFEKYNLDVDLISLDVGGVAWIPVLASGDIDVTSGAGVTAPIVSRSNEAEVVAVASGFVTGPGFEVWQYIVPADSDIQSVEDLAGKTVAVGGAGSTPDLAIDGWLAQNGLEPTDVNKIVIPYGNMPTALLNGQADMAALIDATYYEYLETNPGAEEQFRVLAPARESVPAGELFTAYNMREDFVADHPEVVTAWIAAMTDTVEWIEANPEAAADIIRDNGGFAGRKPYWPEGLCINGDYQADWISILEDAGQVAPGAVPEDSWFTNALNPNDCGE